MRRLNSTARAALVGAAILLSFTPAAMAQAEKGKNQAKTPIVQFSSMLVPKAYTGGRGKYVPITPLVEIKRGSSVTEFCAFSTRVHEAILMTLHSNPVGAIKDGEVILSEPLHKLLIKRINQASGGKEQVSKVHILATTLIMGTGVAGRLPYATIAGCKKFRSLKDKGGVMPMEQGSINGEGE